MTWRVRDRATFRALASRPRHRRGPLALAFVSSGGDGPPRVAYAVSKRVGPAVVRNRVRRRLRAAVARHRPRLCPGTAYLLSAGPEAAAVPWLELEATVGDLLERADRT